MTQAASVTQHSRVGNAWTGKDHTTRDRVILTTDCLADSIVKQWVFTVRSTVPYSVLTEAQVSGGRVGEHDGGAAWVGGCHACGRRNNCTARSCGSSAGTGEAPGGTFSHFRLWALGLQSVRLRCAVRRRTLCLTRSACRMDAQAGGNTSLPCRRPLGRCCSDWLSWVRCVFTL